MFDKNRRLNFSIHDSFARQPTNAILITAPKQQLTPPLSANAANYLGLIKV
jgi:hypothetical protein